MRRLKIALIALALLSAGHAAAHWTARLWGAPRLEISPVLDIGEVAHDQEIALSIGFRNAGSRSLSIDPPIPGCECSPAVLDRSTYVPGEAGQFSFSFRAANPLGTPFERIITITSNDPVEPRRSLIVRGQMRNGLVFVPDTPRFAEVRPGVGWSQTLVVRSAKLGPAFTIKSVSCDLPDAVVGEPRPESPSSAHENAGYLITLTHSGYSQPGRYIGKLVVEPSGNDLDAVTSHVEVEVTSRLQIRPREVLLITEHSIESKTISIEHDSPFSISLSKEYSVPPYLDVRVRPESETRKRWLISIALTGDSNPASVSHSSLKLVIGGVLNENEVVIPVTVVPGAPWVTKTEQRP